MNPWPEVQSEIQEELTRCSQLLNGVRLLPDAVAVRLPRGAFRAWAPVLGRVVGELGEAVKGWAVRSGHRFGGGGALSIEVQLEERERPEVTVTISTPVESPGR